MSALTIGDVNYSPVSAVYPGVFGLLEDDCVNLQYYKQYDIVKQISAPNVDESGRLVSIEVERIHVLRRILDS